MNFDQHRGLTPDKLQFFVAGLSGLNSDEIRKAKLLFLRNEVSQLKALIATYKGFGVAQILFWIIPIFWPILFAQRKSMDAAVTMQKEQIRNALMVWQDDLGKDAFAIEQELETF